MEVTIHRKNGFFDNSYGTGLSLAILFDGTVVGQLETGKALRLELPDVAGALQVGLAGFGSTLHIGRRSDELISISNALDIAPSHTCLAFSVRTRGWVFFDFIGLAYLASLSRWVLALETKII